LKFLSFIFVFLFAQSSFGFMKISNSVKDCNLAKDSVKVHKAVVNEATGNLAHKVAVHGEENRELTDKFSGTVPIICVESNGKRRDFGSANIIDNGRLVGVIHNLLELGTCEDLSSTNKCSIYSQGSFYSFKVNTSLKNQCLKNGGEDEPAILGVLENIPMSNEAYEVECGEIEDNEEAYVVGAYAKNFKKENALKYMGQKRIVGHGSIEKKENGDLNYTIDSGSGMSGGAILVNRNGKYKIAGVHYGKDTKSEYSIEARAYKNKGLKFRSKSEICP
tara:strand:- start:1302 stop:2132 length:831 start_codon:yes stop_codon:yes gene_type:complete